MAFEFLAKDAAAILLQDGLMTTAIWDNTPLKGVRSTLKRQDAATLSGSMYHYDFSFLVPASELKSALVKPEPLRDSLIIDGVTHLILAIDKDIANNYRFHLGAQYG